MYDAMVEKRQLMPLLDGQQHDAEGFLYLYLDALDEELFASIRALVEEREVSQPGQAEVGNRVSMAESTDSPVMRIFGGRFRSTVRAPNQPDSVTTEYWRSFQLDIQHDSVHAVEDALARISDPQPVEPEYLDPSGINGASMQTLIEVLPPALIIHLKRFRYDGGTVKIGKSIQFTSELEIPPDVMVPIAHNPTGTPPGSYPLYGVLCHHGNSANKGHYTVDGLCPK